MYITEKNEAVPSSHKEFKKHLTNMGFVNKGGKKHDEFHHAKSGVSIQVPRHDKIAPGTAKTMWKQAKAAVSEQRSLKDLLSTFRRIIKD